MSTVYTLSGPTASAAIVAVSAESMPPDSPRITVRKHRALRTLQPLAHLWPFGYDGPAMLSRAQEACHAPP